MAAFFFLFITGQQVKSVIVVPVFNLALLVAEQQAAGIPCHRHRCILSTKRNNSSLFYYIPYANDHFQKYNYLNLDYPLRIGFGHLFHCPFSTITGASTLGVTCHLSEITKISATEPLTVRLTSQLKGGRKYLLTIFVNGHNSFALPFPDSIPISESMHISIYLNCQNHFAIDALQQEKMMDHQDQDDSNQRLNQETLLNPPPNHNPLIGLFHGDTLINVYASLSTLQELTVSRPNGELNLSSASSNGVYFLLCCIKDALRFEIDPRDKIKITSTTG